MRIRWTALAVSDLTQICDYLERQASGPTARGVAVSIYTRVSTLLDYPEQGRQGRKSGTRELILSGLP